MSTWGPSYDRKLDGERLHRQQDVIKEVMLSAGECGNWHTLAEIERMTGFPQPSISSQLRHLRKKAFGAYLVEKRRRRNSWEYQVREPVRFEQLSLLGATR